MSEVEPEHILIVDRKRPQSAFADDLASVQVVLSGLGSAQNIHLARLWATRRFLLVEGKDLSILKRIHDLLYPDAESFQSIPSMEIGGWGSWAYAVGSSMAFRNAMGQEVTTYCVLDSDYHTPEQIRSRCEDAKNRQVELHVWSKKETENYFLIPTAISRVLGSRVSEQEPPTPAEVEAKISELADALEDQTFDGLANEYFLEDRAAREVSNQKARTRLRETRERDGNINSLVSGKKVFSALSTWSSSEYGVSFGVAAVLNQLKKDEVDEEIGRVVSSIEHGWSFVESAT